MFQKFKKLHWTEHSKIKMRQYGLSKQKLLGVLYRPERKEKGIVPGTTAVMKTNPVRNSTLRALAISNGASKKKSIWGTAKRAPGEVWIMYKDVKIASVPTRKIISAWRYPGISKPGEEIPIPEDIKQELLNSCNF